MADERMQEAREGLVRQVIADMREKGAGWSRAWVNGAPTNPVSGTVYRGRNALMLAFYMRVDGLDDPRFMTFNQARQKGYKVMKGCHSYPIEKWKQIASDRNDPGKRIRQPKTTVEWERAREDPDIEIRNLPVGHFNLFSARYIDGIEPWEGPSSRVDGDLADFLERNSPVRVKEMVGNEAFYDPDADDITIPRREQFKGTEGFARVLLHEQGHATGHPSRLGRDMSGRALSADPERRAAYAREELVAELNSMFCANELGVPMPQVGQDDPMSKSSYWENHVAYLKGWSHDLEDPEGELMRAASAAGRAADWLMTNCFGPAIEEMERAAPEPERETGLSALAAEKSIEAQAGAVPASGDRESVR